MKFHSRSLIACAPFSCITGAVNAQVYNDISFGGETVFVNNTAGDDGGTNGSGATKGIYVA